MPDPVAQVGSDFVVPPGFPTFTAMLRHWPRTVRFGWTVGHRSSGA